MVLLTAIWSLSAPTYQMQVEEQYNQLLTSGSFKISSKINFRQGIELQSYRLTEVYSGQQSKGLIYFQEMKSESTMASRFPFGKGRFFHDAKAGLSLQFNDRVALKGNETKCQQMGNPANLIRWLDMDWFLKKIPQGTPEHIFGPAKLIYFTLNELKHELNLEEKLDATVKNVEAKLIETIVKDGNKRSVRIMAFFYRQSMDNSTNQIGFPNKIILDFKDNPVPLTVSIDYSEPERTGMSGITEQHSELQRDLALDELNFLTFRDCPRDYYLKFGQNLSDGILRNNQSITDSRKWSFKVKFSSNVRDSKSSSSDDLQDRKATYVVNYDELLNILKVDNLQDELNDDEPTSSPWQQVLDFHDDKGYFCNHNGRECTTYQLSKDLKPSNWIQALIGDGSFVNIGSGFLRGVHMTVYETMNKTTSYRFPIWLLQRLEFTSSSSECLVRVYINHGEFVDKLMMLELDCRYEPTGTKWKISESMRAVIFDFQWQADLLATTESLTSQLFDQDSRSIVKRELLLQLADYDVTKLSYLKQMTSHDIEAHVLRTLQKDFKVSPLSIKNLQSRLVFDTDGYEPTHKVTLLGVSFRQSYPKTVINLESLYRKRQISYNPEIMSLCTADSLLECVQIAFKNGNQILAYHRVDRVCMGIKNEIHLASASPKQKPLKLLDIYRIVVKTQDQSTDSLSDNSNNTESINRQIVWKAGDQDIPELTFKVLNATQHRDLIDEAPVLSNGSMHRRLHGFGFDEQPGVNERIKTSDIDKEQQKMNLALCSSACQASSRCGSYSICVHSGEIQCTLSIVDNDLGDLEMQLNMEQKQASKRKFSASNVNNTRSYTGRTVKFVQYPLCDIYRKNYLDQFTMIENGVRHISLTEGLLLPVRSLNHCAQLCATRNTAALSIEHLINQMVSESTKAHNESTSFRQSYCDRFYYILDEQEQPLNRTLDEYISQSIGLAKLEDILVKPGTDLENPNYCLIPNGQKPNGTITMSFRALEAVYNTVNLFIKNTTVSLKSTTIGLEKRRALDMLTSGRQLDTAKSKQLIEKFLYQHENYQTSSRLEPELCAQSCLMRDFVCKSFDIQQIIENGHPVFLCLMNTLTLEEAERFNKDLIVTVELSDEMISSTHYEPKSRLLPHGNSTWLDQILHGSEDKVIFRLHTLGSLFVIILGLITGWYITWLGLFNNISNSLSEPLLDESTFSDRFLEDGDMFTLPKLQNDA